MFNAYQKGENMSKHLKRIIILIFTISISLTLSVQAFAIENNDINWKDLSDKSGIPVEDLQDAYSKMTEDDFNSAVQHCIDAMDYYSTIPQTPSPRGDVRMDMSDWAVLKSNLSDGSMLITTDSETIGFKHGHISIISGAYSMNLEPLSRVYYMTEHPGSKSGDGLSWRVILSNTENYWRKSENVAIFNVASTSIMTSASSVARSSLVLDKPYNALALKTSTAEYNCSSLVYRCYYNSGLDISKSGSSIVLPKDIAQSSNVILVYEYGNFSWR